MALFGVLSLVQTVALPGYLLVRSLRVARGILDACILSFAMSLVINHVLVAGLALLKIYRPPVLYAVFAAELVLLLAMDGRRLKMGLSEAARAWWGRLRGFFRAIESAPAVAGAMEYESGSGHTTLHLKTAKTRRKVAFRSAKAALLSRSERRLWSFQIELGLRRAILAAAMLVIGGFALSGIAAVGQIFQQWDAVVSWNRWAVDWAANRLPYATSIYPQLMPTNFSLSYVFMQSSEVWIFAKSFQFLFCLMLLVAMLDLARIEGSFGFVPGVVITYCLLVALLRFRMLSSGYADVPLAFFALAPIYVLLLARSASESQKRGKLLFFGAVLAAGAALTKQTGLYIAAFYPLLAWRFVLRCGGPGRLRKHLPALLGMCLVMGLLIAPWYLYKVFDFQAGFDKNNTALLVTDFHEGRNLTERILHGGGMVTQAITPLGAAMLLIAVAAAMADSLQRWLLGVFVVPLGLVWAIAFSYDLRNLAVIVPWVGAAAGIGLMRIVYWTGTVSAAWADGRTRLRFGLVSGTSTGDKQESIANSVFPDFLSVGHLLGLLVLLVIAVCLCVSNETLLKWQRYQQRMAGVPELNRELYAFDADHPGDATIATDYQAMRWLPELGRRSVVCTCHDFAAFRQTFDRPDVRYVLVRLAGAAADVRAFLQGQTAARFVFENHGFAFYEKRPLGQAKVAAVP